MKLEEFLSELTDTTRVVIIECHSDKENDEFTRYCFPDIHDYILFYGERWEIVSGVEMRDEYKETCEYEICCIEMKESSDKLSYIAVFVVNR